MINPAINGDRLVNQWEFAMAIAIDIEARWNSISENKNKNVLTSAQNEEMDKYQLPQRYGIPSLAACEKPRVSLHYFKIFSLSKG